MNASRGPCPLSCNPHSKAAGYVCLSPLHRWEDQQRVGDWVSVSQLVGGRDGMSTRLCGPKAHVLAAAFRGFPTDPKVRTSCFSLTTCVPSGAERRETGGGLLCFLSETLPCIAN